MLSKKAPVKPLKLNLGCGNNKIPDYINIDIEPSVKPDLVWDFISKKLPYNDNTVAEVILIHTIEHIRKDFHQAILQEIHRVLQPQGRVLMAYPEFLKCVENWKTNYRGKKTFWEHTLYGRQLYPSDYHVCIMDTAEFSRTLKNNGFKEIKSQPEVEEPFNTMITAIKGVQKFKYEAVIKADMKAIRIRK